MSTPGPEGAASIWAVLGVEPGVTEAELKLAFRRRAVETHPDQGGDPESFRRVLAAYDEARRPHPPPKPPRRGSRG